MPKKANQFDAFGLNVFKEDLLKKHLSRKEFKMYKQMIDKKLPLDKKIAKKVAKVMKEWAIKNGATHYSHWFQPLNGTTAEKQTSFLSATLENKLIVDFPVDELIVGETDASSFPNGGTRSVFEARGLTKWDYTYPAFLKEDLNGKVLCIPTILESPDGISLDKRTPLLNSCEALNKQIIRILRLFGDNETTETFSIVGIEQEYFLIKKEHFDKRKDLILTGRTLFGKELIRTVSKHYMGAISEKTGKYMKNVETELWKLGIPEKVKHNEVAARQYELVPHYENLKLGANHDFLVMEILQREAKRENLVCLLNEKPFKGISGSGKHNNWSIFIKQGKNLFSYGETPIENARFITIIMALVSGIDKYSDLIRATVASSGNDNRLSGYEAPSSIVSMYLGDELTDVITQIINDKENNIKLGETPLKLFKTKITDRNRTSPFAFIGNRFEFRMPGSYAPVSVCNTALNTIMADALSEISNQLENSKDFYKDLKKVICKLYKQHSKIIYNGNSYSEDWEKEAKKRGLKNVRTAPEAFKAFIDNETIELFEGYNVYSREELLARYNIKLEKYVKNIYTEATVMIEMAEKEILPNCIKYTDFLANTISSKIRVEADVSVEKQITNIVSTKIVDLYKNIKYLKESLQEEENIKKLPERATYCQTRIKENMNLLRETTDILEDLIPKEYWPIPTYSDILN